LIDLGELIDIHLHVTLHLEKMELSRFVWSSQEGLETFLRALGSWAKRWIEDPSYSSFEEVERAG
jgi:hypothetical protein